MKEITEILLQSFTLIQNFSPIYRFQTWRNWFHYTDCPKFERDRWSLIFYSSTSHVAELICYPIIRA